MLATFRILLNTAPVVVSSCCTLCMILEVRHPRMAPGTLKAVLNLTREDHPLSNSCLQRHMCQKTLPIMSKVSSSVGHLFITQVLRRVGAAGTRIFGCATEEACYAYVLEQEPLRPPCSTMRGLLVVYVTGLSSTQVEYLHGCQAQTRTFYVVDQERSAAFRRNFSEPRYWPETKPGRS